MAGAGRGSGGALVRTWVSPQSVGWPRPFPGDIIPHCPPERRSMRPLFVLVAWFLLLILCWPVAILALVLWPLMWLISLPNQIVGIFLEALFAFLQTNQKQPAQQHSGERVDHRGA